MTTNKIDMGIPRHLDSKEIDFKTKRWDSKQNRNTLSNRRVLLA